MEKKTEIMLHVLKMQWFSMLPKYVKLISEGFFFLHVLHLQMWIN